MWEQVNKVLDVFFGFVLGPLAEIAPVWQGVILGLPVGLLALLIYRVASNQAGITRSKDRIKGHLLELLLFRDDLGVILRAQGNAFWQCLIYLRHALLPMSILIIPVLLLIIQIETRFAHREFRVGEAALVQVVIEDGLVASSIRPDPALVVGDGLGVETPAFRLNSENLIVWRVRPNLAGTHSMTVRLNDKDIERTLSVNPPDSKRVVPTVYRQSDIRTLGSPGTDAIEDESVAVSVAISYPYRSDTLVGLTYVSWSLFCSSLVFGFLLRRPLGVDF